MGFKHLLKPMGIFGDSYPSAFDEVVEKVTAETATAENWSLILDICDKIKADAKHPKAALTSIRKRLNNRDPHVIMLALSLLDSCWSNCGTLFRKEVSSASFINELMSKATHSTPQIGQKTRVMLKKWVDNECKADSSLSLITSLYRNLVEEGFTFEPFEPVKKQVISNDPNVVSSEEEEKAIAKAIALSLEDSERKKTSSNMYPTANGSNGQVHASKAVYPPLMSAPPKLILKKVKFDNSSSPTPSVISDVSLIPSVNSLHAKQQAAPQASERTVRALYDFEAAEDNELSFVTGDLITVTDDSNPNWWRGRIGVQQGLFPSSFVSSDLSEVKPESSQSVPKVKPVAVIDEATLLKCIQLLEDCDPTGEIPDSAELVQAEAASLAQGALIDGRLAAIDKQSNALAQVDIAIRDVLALYDSAVQQANPYQSQSYQPQTMPSQQPNVEQMAGPAQYQQYPTTQPPNMTQQQYHQYQTPAGYQQPHYGYQQYATMPQQPSQQPY